jgi:hypothetical protein
VSTVPQHCSTVCHFSKVITIHVIDYLHQRSFMLCSMQLLFQDSSHVCFETKEEGGGYPDRGLKVGVNINHLIW